MFNQCQSSIQLLSLDGPTSGCPASLEHNKLVRANRWTFWNRIATIGGNGLDIPGAAAFDGERILVTNLTAIACHCEGADLTPIGSFPTGANTSRSGRAATV